MIPIESRECGKLSLRVSSILAWNEESDSQGDSGKVRILKLAQDNIGWNSLDPTLKDFYVFFI